MLGYVRVVRGMKGMLGYVRVVRALRIVRARGTPRYAGAGTGDAAVRRGLARGATQYSTLGLAQGTTRGTSGGWGDIGTLGVLPYSTVRYLTVPVR